MNQHQVLNMIIENLTGIDIMFFEFELMISTHNQ